AAEHRREQADEPELDRDAEAEDAALRRAHAAELEADREHEREEGGAHEQRAREELEQSVEAGAAGEQWGHAASAMRVGCQLQSGVTPWRLRSVLRTEKLEIQTDGPPQLACCASPFDFSRTRVRLPLRALVLHCSGT